ncbi:MAG: ribosome silencing factor, partial [Clostridia bacterium]|nr:ribosome silencing factor [Clostridia bacterium]
MDNIQNTEKILTPLDPADAKTLAEAIADVLDSKKGRDIKVLRVEDKTVISEYFVLCTGNSSTQIKALAGEVEFRIGERGVEPYGVEGRDNNTWMLLDYSNVIVHIFSREAREFYNLPMNALQSFQPVSCGPLLMTRMADA